MLKSFLGFDLLQQKEQQKKLRKQSRPRACGYIKVLAGVLAAAVVLCMPLSAFGIEGLTIVERRVIALFFFAAIMWITEGIPSWSTSVAIIVVLLLISWFVIKHFFPFTQKKIELKIEHQHEQKLSHWQEVTVYATFAVTVLLWMTDQWTGVDANVVAMLPVGVFCVTGIVNRYDLSEINWSVLWMVAGGFALGVALGSSLAMILPISTPPNALAHATGYIAQKDMAKIGIIMGIIGLVLGYTMLIFAGKLGWM